MNRVFRKGDPCPGAHIRGVMDKEDRIWPRVGDTQKWLCSGGGEWEWEYVITFEPLVACDVDYEAAVAADEVRRNGGRHA